MCGFCSLVSDGMGNVYYQDADIRRQIREGVLDYGMDSHTSIAHQHGFIGTDEDHLNKWEYDPLRQHLTVDQINTTDDRNAVEQFCHSLDWSTVVPELVIKSTTNPFTDRHADSVTEQDLALLRKWVSVGHLVWGPVRDSVRDSVCYLVGFSVWNSVRDSVWNSVGDSVWNSVRDSVRDWVEDSMRDLVWAYIGSFFRLPKWKYVDHQSGEYPFQPAVDLWERGLVPSYDKKVWRLHGHEGEVLWEGTIG